MFAVELLAAGEGDALVVEYGPRGSTKCLLVDGGPARHWPQVRARLLKRKDPQYEAVVVTHIDEDHIGGILALLDDPDLRSRVNAIWFNGYVHCGAGGSVLGPIHGEQLTQRIAQGGYKWNPGFPDPPTPGTGGPVVVRPSSPLPTIDFRGGARAVVLGPGPSQLRRLGRHWEKVVSAAGLTPGMGAGGAGAFMRKRNETVSTLPARVDRATLGQLATRRQTDSSAANGSSIAFVLEYEGKRLLLTGDARPAPLVAGLKRYAQLVGEAHPRFDLVKLPHHGSGANVTQQLLAEINADRYLISTNGDGYGHPDDSAIARLVLGSPHAVTIISNYASRRMLSWAQRSDDIGLTVTLPTSGAGIRASV
ncbi:ComEC/Rec2 family competence protein [Propioniciclava flava]